jgi:hypothetical protein
LGSPETALLSPSTGCVCGGDAWDLDCEDDVGTSVKYPALDDPAFPDPDEKFTKPKLPAVGLSAFFFPLPSQFNLIL